MVSTPSPNTFRPEWMENISWKTSDPFQVQWLSKVPVEFFRIGHIKNPYNDNQAVLVGKDGQEVEAECGRRLLQEMHEFAEAWCADDGRSRGRDDFGNGGGNRDARSPHGRGDDGPRYIKREDSWDRW